jgi:hypothetical protein
VTRRPWADTSFGDEPLVLLLLLLDGCGRIFQFVEYPSQSSVIGIPVVVAVRFHSNEMFRQCSANAIAVVVLPLD